MQDYIYLYSQITTCIIDTWVIFLNVYFLIFLYTFQKYFNLLELLHVCVFSIPTMFRFLVASCGYIFLIITFCLLHWFSLYISFTRLYLVLYFAYSTFSYREAYVHIYMMYTLKKKFNLICQKHLLHILRNKHF